MVKIAYHNCYTPFIVYTHRFFNSLVQVSAENPDNLLLSVQIPEAPPEVKFLNGLPEGALDSVRQHYGPNVKILEEPVEGFRLTLSLDLLSIDKSEG